MKSLRERLGVPSEDNALALDTDRQRSSLAPEAATARATAALSRTATIRAASLTAEAAASTAAAAEPSAAAVRQESTEASAIEAVKVAAPAAEASASHAALQQFVPISATATLLAAVSTTAQRDALVPAAELTPAMTTAAESFVLDLQNVRCRNPVPRLHGALPMAFRVH